MSELPGSKRIKFDPTVTAGNMLTAGAMCLGLVTWGLRLEGRVDIVQERQLRFEAQVLQYRAEDRAAELIALTELRGALRRIEDILLRQSDAQRARTN